MEPLQAFKSALLTEMEDWARTSPSDRSQPKEVSTRMITISKQLEPSTQPQLLKLPKYWGEYWLNIRIDQKELVPDPD